MCATYLHRPDNHPNGTINSVRTQNDSEAKTSHSIWDEKIDDSKEISSKMDKPAQRFGEIPGAPVGTTWNDRIECHDAGVHCQIEPGIHGIKGEGAFSIVVSGQYKDDKDAGDTIIYTGSGGHIQNRDGTREQVRDQEWTDFGNEALRKSSETGKPVRVIRGSELDSEFAPWKGFRYDGLYICKRAWKEKERNGYYYICRYDMERVPGQPPLRRRSTTVNRYKPLPGSEAMQPPAPVPAPVTGRQRIRQQVQASLDNDASSLGIPL